MLKIIFNYFLRNWVLSQIQDWNGVTASWKIKLPKKCINQHKMRKRNVRIHNSDKPEDSTTPQSPH